MKTILVLTDFSINADYAADYALALAQNVEANLLLCNIYERPGDENIPNRKAWPKQACEENSINDLGALMARLKTNLDKTPAAKNYKPEINQCSIDATDQDLAAIVRKHNIWLAVISAHSKLNGIFQKNHAWDFIDQATFPVMVIPYQVRYKPFRQITFATGMQDTDAAVLESVITIAKYSGAEVLIAHITDKEINVQSNQAPAVVTYPKVTYHTIKGGNVISAIKKQCLYADLLVLVHHKRGFLQNLFKPSVTRKMATQPYKPLLIFPQSGLN